MCLSFCIPDFKQIASIRNEWGRGGANQSDSNKGMKVLKLLKTETMVFLCSPVKLHDLQNHITSNHFVVYSRHEACSNVFFSLSLSKSNYFPKPTSLVVTDSARKSISVPNNVWDRDGEHIKFWED